MSPSKRTGRIVRDGSGASIEFERRLPYPIQSVWAAITDPNERAAWFGLTTIDPRAGGAIAMTAEGPPAPPEMRKMSGKILVWDPPRVFEHEWKQSLIGDTVIRYELTAEGNETILKLVHSGLRVADAKGYGPGEHAFLDRLEAHLGQAALPGWQQRYGEVRDEYL